MDESNEFLYEPVFFGKIVMAVEKIAGIINQNMGMRIGQSTVCSQKMHTFQPEKPQEVNILQDSDAGQTFYHRKESGSVYHLDIFHECGLVDHHVVAAEVRTAVEGYNGYYEKYIGNNDKVQVDLFDIQTGTGGGRVTGSLDFGEKLTLRKGHMNHVHVTMALSQQHVACIVYVVMAVEHAILSCSLELRRNEKIENVKGTAGTGKTDLSAYADQSDSLLQKKSSSGRLDPYEKNQDATHLMNNFNVVQELKAFLIKNHSNNGFKPTGHANSQPGVECLTQNGMIELHDNRETLTQPSKEVKSFVESHLPEIEIHLQQVVRKAKCFFVKAGRSKKLQNKLSCLGEQNLLKHMEVGHEFGDVDISESISVVARRMVEKDERLFKMTPEDLRYSVKFKKQKIEFCVLIDASSSMEGQRIRAAKKLARFLFLSTADRISVIVFQENRAWVQVPFTRDVKQLEDRLEDIKTYGKTPLALGLTACIQYLDKNKVHNPLIILITDGVPTLGMMTSNPVHDALEVAKRIKAKKYGFTCIGLKPHLDYLNQLSKIAGGSVYAVDELEKIGTC